jgi:hypothetical protein
MGTEIVPFLHQKGAILVLVGVRWWLMINMELRNSGMAPEGN